MPRMHKSKAAGPYPALTSHRKTPSDEGNSVGLQSFLPVDDVNPDPLARAQSVDAAAAQGGDMDEHILAAAVGRNEPVALFGLEPFDGAVQRCCRTWPAITVEAATARLRSHGGAAVDIDHIRDERAFGAGADFAGDQGAFMNVLEAGAAQDCH